MAIIYSYPIATPQDTDLLIISRTPEDPDEIYNYSVSMSSVANYVIDRFIDPDATDFKIPVFNQDGTRITGSIMSQDSSPSNGVAGTKITIAGDLTLERDQSDTTLTLVSDSSNVDPGGEQHNPSIKFIQDGSSQNAAVGFNIIDDTGGGTIPGTGNRFWIVNAIDDNTGEGGITFGTAQVDGWDNAIGRFIIRGDGKGLFGHPDSLYSKTLGSQFEIYDNRDENTTTDPSFSVYSVVDYAAPSGNEGAGGIKQILDVYNNGVFEQQEAMMLIPGTNSSDFAASTPLSFYTNSDMDTRSPSGFAAKIFNSGNWLLDSTNTNTDPGYKLKVAGTGLFTDQVTIPATPVAATDAASKSYVDALTRVESLTAGTYLNNSGTAADVVLNHDATTRSDTTSSSSPAYGGTIDVVNTVTTNATGHVTAVDIETVTFPAAEDYTWTAAADTGSNRIIQDGNTIDFKGGTNINTANVGGETRFNLDDNVSILGTIIVGGSLGTSGIYGDTLLGTSSTDLVEILATLRLDGPVKDKTNTLGTAGKLLVSNSNGELNYSPRLLVDETNGRLSIFNATASTIPSGDNFTLDVRTEKGRLQIEGNDVSGLKLDFENSLGVGTAAIENNGSQNQILKIRSHGTSGTLGEIRFETNSVEAVRIDENQRVGVGTISPGAMLDVVASSSTSRALDVQTNSGSLSITNSDTNGCKINFKFGTQNTTTASLENNGSQNQFLVLRAQGTTNNDGNIRFVTNGTDAMRIDENQNVGIGVTSPASKLEVDGGDIEIDDAASGLILRSPNGTRYRIKVDNSGNLSATAV